MRVRLVAHTSAGCKCRGIQEVVVMDSCLPAMEIVRRRNASGGRLGLYCCAADPGDVQEPQLSSHEAGLRFDLVVRGGGRSPHYACVL